MSLDSLAQLISISENCRHAPTQMHKYRYVLYITVHTCIYVLISFHTHSIRCLRKVNEVSPLMGLGCVAAWRRVVVVGKIAECQCRCLVEMTLSNHLFTTFQRSRERKCAGKWRQMRATFATNFIVCQSCKCRK